MWIDANLVRSSNWKGLRWCTQPSGNSCALLKNPPQPAFNSRFIRSWAMNGSEHKTTTFLTISQRKELSPWNTGISVRNSQRREALVQSTYVGRAWSFSHSPRSSACPPARKLPEPHTPGIHYQHFSLLKRMGGRAENSQLFIPAGPVHRPALKQELSRVASFQPQAPFTQGVTRIPEALYQGRGAGGRQSASRLNESWVRVVWPLLLNLVPVPGKTASIWSTVNQTCPVSQMVL